MKQMQALSRRQLSEVLRQEVAITEVTDSIQFRSRKSHANHVLKHLLGPDSKDEKWHQLLDPDQLSSARDEYAPNRRYEQECRKLARLYEMLLSQVVLAACEAHTSHAHLAEYELNKDLYPIPDKEVIWAWSPDKRLVIIASRLVRNGQDRPYVIMTGYRTNPKEAKRRFTRVQRDRIEQRIQISNQALLAFHDEDQ